MESGTLLSEVDVADFMGNKVEKGELSLSKIDNAKVSVKVPYPSKIDMIRPNEYSIIGYNEMSDIVPIIF